MARPDNVGSERRVWEDLLRTRRDDSANYLLFMDPPHQGQGRSQDGKCWKLMLQVRLIKDDLEHEKRK